MSEFYEGATGLLETTSESKQSVEELRESAVSYAAFDTNVSDIPRCLHWDDAFDDFLKWRTSLLLSLRPTYKSWDVSPDVPIVNQGQEGSCGGAGFANSFYASQKSTAVFRKKKVKELAWQILYSIARGNGKLNWGAGCDLDRLSTWGTKVGSFLAADFGAYNQNGSTVRKPTEAELKDALTRQSIVVYVDGNNIFDKVYRACKAGYGVEMGCGKMSKTPAVKNGLLRAGKKTSTAHAMAFTDAFEKGGERYVYLMNSWGNIYPADDLRKEKQNGMWYSEEDVNEVYTDRYGTWFVNIAEL